jgi:hypothetical protein
MQSAGRILFKQVLGCSKTKMSSSEQQCREIPAIVPFWPLWSKSQPFLTQEVVEALREWLVD